jgi:hypothetical protein
MFLCLVYALSMVAGSIPAAIAVLSHDEPDNTKQALGL